jgi:uncharacterized protein (TIGR00251 family)
MKLPYILSNDPANDGITLDIRLSPGSASSAIVGLQNGQLKVKVTARAIEGKANQALCEFLADYFRVSKSSVIIVRGETSRSKTVFVQGKGKDLEARLVPLINEGPGS